MAAVQVRDTDLSFAVVEGDPALHERLHVHAVYDTIAPHFSQTRYKPWPIITQFLSSLPTGSVGLDSGTGNGKYLPLPVECPSKIFTIGLDRSINLLAFAQHQGNREHDVLLGDALECCWRPGIFDYAISIATIHHLATPKRRRKAVESLLQCVKPSGGRILIYVWAVDQDQSSKRSIPTSIAERASTNGVDAFVPWVLHRQTDSTASLEESAPSLLKRYYHFFAAGELQQLARDAGQSLGLLVGPPPGSNQSNLRGFTIVKDGYEKSNFFVELESWEQREGE